MFTSGPEQWLGAKSSLKNGRRSTLDKGTIDIFLRTRHLVRLEHRFQRLNGPPLIESALPTEIYKVWGTQPCGQDGGSREIIPNIIYVYIHLEQNAATKNCLGHFFYLQLESYLSLRFCHSVH